MSNSSTGNWSLRQRLTIMLFSLVLMLWVLSAVVIYVKAENESQELFDMAISETAGLLLFVSEHELLEVSNLDVTGHDRIEYTNKHQYLSFQLWDNTGRLRYRSANAPKTPLAPLDVDGFSWNETLGEVSRTFNLQDSNGILRIIVSEPLTHRKEISAHFFWGLFLFSLILLPISYLGVRFIVGKALGPVERCVDQVNKLDASNLNRVEVDDVPDEIGPFLQALNSAIERIQNGIMREKRFTADAAHELRTPLAGVKANIQLLQKISTSPNALESDVMVDTLEGVDRCSRMINQLLALSRSDAMATKTTSVEVLNLQRTIEDVLQLESAHAKSKNVMLSFSVDAPEGVESPLQSIAVKGYPTAIELLLRNLLNNAIAYQTCSGEAQIVVRYLPEQASSNQFKVSISVLDNGPGIAAAERELVFNRFFRGQPNQTRGSGLGLSICKEVADLHNTTIYVGEGIDGKGVGFSFTLAGEKVAPS